MARAPQLTPGLSNSRFVIRLRSAMVQPQYAQEGQLEMDHDVTSESCRTLELIL
jgi:hypothetical protein